MGAAFLRVHDAMPNNTAEINGTPCMSGAEFSKIPDREIRIFRALVAAGSFNI
tara:strand:+ start:346 stop:504 length:159 start_codon:yes stop_codon:yes gene_type:complete